MAARVRKLDRRLTTEELISRWRQSMQNPQPAQPPARKPRKGGAMAALTGLLVAFLLGMCALVGFASTATAAPTGKIASVQAADPIYFKQWWTCRRGYSSNGGYYDLGTVRWYQAQGFYCYSS